MRFKQILGECDSKEWGRKIDDFCWQVIQLLNLAEITGEKEYVASVCYVATDNEKDIEEALSCVCGVRAEMDEEEIVGHLFEGGWKDTVWQKAGENPIELLMEAYKIA